MRWNISPHGYDPRTVDLLAILALLILVIGSGWYLEAGLSTPPATTALIVPSQSVRW